MTWTYGHNLAGHLPDDPAALSVVDTWQEAVEGLVEHARAYANEHDEALDDGDEREVDELRPTVDAALAKVVTARDAMNSAWVFTVVDSWDRRIVFWLQEHV